MPSARRSARVAGAAVGLAFGVLAMGASLHFGDPADWSRGLGWLVLVLAAPIGALLGPTASGPGARPALTASLRATAIALPAGALLYALALELTTGRTGAELIVGTLGAAALGLVLGVVPLGIMTFAAASLAVALVRVILFGPREAVRSYAGSARSRANR